MLKRGSALIVVLLAVLLLSSCATAPETAPGPRGNLATAFAASAPVAGEAHDDADSWAFTLTVTSFEPSTGAFEGQIEWPSLAAIHKIRGILSDAAIEFEEVEFIQEGDAILNCKYVAELVEVDGKIEGTWGGCLDYEGMFWMEFPQFRRHA